MRTIADQQTLHGLVERLGRLRPDTARRWGTITAGEMLCHLGDAHAAVLGIRPLPVPPSGGGPRPVFKWLSLYAPIPWPKGVKTRRGVDPKVDGTRPSEFEQDRLRAIGTLQSLAAADSSTLAGRHFLFGPMSARDWHRWAYRHVSHHLRQFGV